MDKTVPSTDSDSSPSSNEDKPTSVPLHAAQASLNDNVRINDLVRLQTTDIDPTRHGSLELNLEYSYYPRLADGHTKDQDSLEQYKTANNSRVSDIPGIRPLDAIGEYASANRQPHHTNLTTLIAATTNPIIIITSQSHVRNLFNPNCFSSSVSTTPRSTCHHLTLPFTKTIYLQHLHYHPFWKQKS